MKVQVSYLIVLVFVLTACTTSSEKNCDLPPKITYHETVSKLIERNCFQCHAPDVYKKKASRNKIFDYKSLKEKAASGILMGSVNHQPGFIAMPYKKGVKIDTCDIAILQKWIDGGMLE